MADNTTAEAVVRQALIRQRNQNWCRSLNVELFSPYQRLRDIDKTLILIYQLHITTPSLMSTSTNLPRELPISLPMYSFLTIKGRSCMRIQKAASIILIVFTYCSPEKSLTNTRHLSKLQGPSQTTLSLSKYSSNSNTIKPSPISEKRRVLTGRQILHS